MLAVIEDLQRPLPSLTRYIIRYGLPLVALQDPTWQKLQMVATLCNNSRFVVVEKEEEGKETRPPLDLVRFVALCGV